MTITVLVTLVAVAVPGFCNVIQDTRIVTETNNLVSVLALGRSEAAKRGSSVTVCASNDGTNCSGSDWGAGWIVFTDGGTSGMVDGTDAILRVASAINGGITLTASGGVTFVQYKATGMIAQLCESCVDSNEPAITVAGGATFNVCDSTRSNETGRAVSLLGRNRGQGSLIRREGRKTQGETSPLCASLPLSLITSSPRLQVLPVSPEGHQNQRGA